MNSGQRYGIRDTSGSDPRGSGRNLRTPGETGPSRSPIVGAFLSFVFPGLGELYAGVRARAAIFGLPVLAFSAWLIVLARGGITHLAVDLFDTSVSSVLFVAIVVTGLLRLASIVDAYGVIAGLRIAGLRHSNRPSSGLLVALLVTTVGIHGVAGLYAASFWSAGGVIFAGGNSQGDGPGSGGAPVAGLPGASNDPFAGVLPSPARSSTRVNILLLGADSGLGYDHALTDTQILVSIDTASKQVVMASVPRDIAEFPMYSGGTFPGKINSLMSTAAANQARYPDGGIGTLAKEISYLLGVDINYYAFVNLSGFAKLIDAVGGVDVVNPTDIVDPGYGFPDGKTGFFMKAGPQHLNSRIGLAFVRTREGIGDNDYTRARRQQLVLQGLRQKLTSPSMLVKVPSLLDALSKTIRTDFPVGRVSEMLSLAQEIPDSAIQKFVLGPPYAVNPPMATTGGVWILRLDIAEVKKWSAQVFGADSRFYVGPDASPAASVSPGTP